MLDCRKLYRTNDLVSSAVNCKGERGRDKLFLDSDSNKVKKKNLFRHGGNLNTVYLIFQDCSFFNCKDNIIVILKRFPRR